MNYAPLTNTSPERIRQEIVDSLHRTFEGFDGGLKMFPAFLIEAIENRVWEHPRQLNMGIVPPITFHEFICASYPRGIGADFETVERFIAHDERALLAWDQVTRKPHGGERQGAGRKPAEPAHDPETGEIKADNVSLEKAQPRKREVDYGNSAQAGLRRIEKAAKDGDARAAALLDQIIDPKSNVSVHKACVELGFRRSPTPMGVVQTAWRKASREEREQIAAWIDEQMSPLRRSAFR